MPTNRPSYRALLSTFLPPGEPSPLLPPPKPHHPSLTAAISSLSLHPTLEALLHILNGDLSSAHFLVRHMQAPPRWEGMLLHALLHRVEGDTENARAWYGDVCRGCTEKPGDDKGEHVHHDVEDAHYNLRNGKQETDTQPQLENTIWTAVWGTAGGLPSVHKFLDRVHTLRLRRPKHEREEEWQREKAQLEGESEREVRGILAWCEGKFGTGEWEDASVAWVRDGEKTKEIAEKMITGGEGWRTF